MGKLKLIEAIEEVREIFNHRIGPVLPIPSSDMQIYQNVEIDGKESYLPVYLAKAFNL